MHSKTPARPSCRDGGGEKDQLRGGRRGRGVSMCVCVCVWGGGGLGGEGEGVFKKKGKVGGTKRGSGRVGGRGVPFREKGEKKEM